MKKILVFIICICALKTGFAQTRVIPPSAGYDANVNNQILKSKQLQIELKRLAQTEQQRLTAAIHAFDQDGDHVDVYEDKALQGKHLSLKEGYYNLEKLGIDWNDKISSVIVPENYIVRFYENDNFTGANYDIWGYGVGKIPWLGANYAYLLPIEWNDRASSIEVKKITK